MSENLKKYTCQSVLFCSGGAGYGLVEILCRGYTHLSMLIAGGLCFCFLIRISKSRRCLALKILAGALCITAVEFTIGCIVNLWLGLNVWDYSDEHLHLFGQICPRFTLLWGLLCAIVIPLCGFFAEGGPIRRKFYEPPLSGKSWSIADPENEPVPNKVGIKDPYWGIEPNSTSKLTLDKPGNLCRDASRRGLR